MNLRIGDTGPRVARLHRRLHAAGYTHFDEDGEARFSSLTDAAVRRFQCDAGLVEDGIVGPRTEAALRLRAPLLLGIDVSHHQDPGRLDFVRLVERDPSGIPRRRPEQEQGIRFAIIRATIGETGEDREWREHAKRAVDAGVPFVGLYHLLKVWQPVRAQSERLAEAMSEAGRLCASDGIAFPMLDVEWTVEHGRETQQIEGAGEAALDFARAMSALTSQRCVIYTAPAFVELGAKSGHPWPAELEQYPLALAHFAGPGRPISTKIPGDLAPPKPWDWATIGQFDGDGGLRSPDGQDIDFCWYEGTARDFSDEICAPFCEDTTP